MATYVIGDIHGQVKALEKCLELSGFDMENDKLICLGDVCDRGPHVKESFDLLLKVKNLVYILGNHDKWFLDWVLTGHTEIVWEYRYGKITRNSYQDGKIPEEHIELLRNARLYYEDNNRLFAHAGFMVNKPLEEQNEYDLLMSRDLIEYAFEIKDEPGIDLDLPFDEVFVGHTPTQNYDSQEPIFIKGLWLLDTGAGWGYRLTIMNVDTKEFWQANIK